jgi:hypothetical protein
MIVLFQGLSSESDKQGKLLGNYTYREDGKPLQFFPVQVCLLLPNKL